MSLVVECKPDEALAVALGLSSRIVEHGTNKVGVCSQVSRRDRVSGMVDEDPQSEQPPYLRRLKMDSYSHGIRVLLDESRNCRLIVLCPRLEEWLVATARDAGLKMTNFGFSSDSGNYLHREINYRLDGVKRLTKELLERKNPRILRLQSLLREIA